jgi:hypothetical protein
VAVPDEMVTAMRTYLLALHADSGTALDESDRQFLALLKARKIEGLQVLLLAAFTAAACRRFSPVWSPAEIIRYVAEVRSDSAELATQLSPLAAENQLRIALGQQVPPHPDMEARGRAQMILLGALTSDYTEDELDALLSEARMMADQSIADRQQSH